MKLVRYKIFPIHYITDLLDLCKDFNKEFMHEKMLMYVRINPRLAGHIAL